LKHDQDHFLFFNRCYHITNICFYNTR
jgi:hypothetical protein